MTKEDQMEFRSRSIEQALRTSGLSPYQVTQQAQEYYDFVVAGKLPKRGPKAPEEKG